MTEATSQAAIEIDDCWNRIGVWGPVTPRCERLEEFVHCRNCDTYSAAGRLMLEHRLPSEYEESWAKIYAQDKQEQLVDTESATIFRLGDEWLALPTLMVKEITEVHPVHSLPHQRDPVVRGLINLRGQIRICVSLGRLMEIERAEKTVSDTIHRVYERMLVLANDTSHFIFLVSEVKGTHRFHSDELKPPPSTLAQAKGAYTRGILSWQGHHVAFLDAELLLYSLDKSLT